MINIIKKYGFYEYFYLFVMVVFMAQMTGDTRYYTFSISRPLPSLIPLVLTIVLLTRHKVSFDNKWLKTILFFFIIWFVAYSIVTLSNGGVYLPLWVSYLVVIILYAYIHAAVFGKDMFLIFEKIMVWLASISLVFYVFQIIFPGAASSFFSLFPDTGERGYNVLYIYKYFYADIERDYYIGIVRNSGCSWEPGRFSVMLVYAICVNLFKNGRITLNKNLIILNIALLTTFSTTGYVLAFVAYLLFSINRISIGRILLVLAVFVPLGFLIYKLDFMSVKFINQFGVIQDFDNFIFYENYREEENQVALERIPSIGIEFKNWLAEPILGYGYWHNSWFYKEITHYATTCGGLMQVISMYGILLGGFFYYCLFRSSQSISKLFGNKREYILLIVTLIASVGYPIFGVMFFTSIWFSGLFIPNIKK